MTTHVNSDVYACLLLGRTHSPRGRKAQPGSAAATQHDFYLSGHLTDRWVCTTRWVVAGSDPREIFGLFEPRKTAKTPTEAPPPRHTSQGTLSRPGGVSGGVPPASGRVPECVGRLRAGYIRYTGFTCRAALDQTETKAKKKGF